MAKILILGGAGFIGTHLASSLADRPEHEITLVDNLARGQMDEDLEGLLSRSTRVKLLQGDLTEPSLWEGLGGPFEHVYLLAGIVGVQRVQADPARVLKSHTAILFNTLEWVARVGCRRFFFASSSEVYSGGVELGWTPIPTPEKVPMVVLDPYNPRSSYGATKMLGEIAVAQYARLFGFQAVIARYHNVYGPRMGLDHVIPELMERIWLRADPLAVYGLEQTRAFCYVLDAIEACQALMECPLASCETVHIGTNQQMTIQELLEKLLTLTNFHPALETHPAPAGAVSRRCPSIEKLYELTGFRPRVSIEEGLFLTWEWYRRRFEQAMKRPQTATSPLETFKESPLIPLSIPELHGNEWRYLKECLDTRWVSSVGPFVDQFERVVAGYLGTGDGVATVSGTAALHVALLVAGIKPDEEVLVPCLAFIAPANAIRYVGAWPVFMDADPTTWQMDPTKVVDFTAKECQWKEGKLLNKTTGRQIKAILPVHILGHPCEMDPLLEIAQRYDLRVIEDAAESLGAQYKGRKVGCLGEIGCLSFNGNKIITTGGGGMFITRNPEWAQRARYLTTQAKDDPMEYIHSEIGYNYRLTNLQAALGCAQMEQLEQHIRSKLQMAQRYRLAFAALPGVECMPSAPWAQPISWLFTIRLKNKNPGSSQRLVAFLASRGIQARRLWRPLHLLKGHQDAQAYRIETAVELYAQAVSLPSSVGLAPADQERVIRAVWEWEEL